MDETEYHAIDAIRFSRLKLMAVSALAYHDPPDIDSDAMALGRAVHAAVLTPGDFEATFRVRPAALGSAATKASKAWALDVPPGVDILTAAQGETVRRMTESVLACPEARDLLDDAAAIEHAYEWTDIPTGLRCKARPDLLTRSDAIVDLKSTRDVSEWAFSAQIARLHYHAQLAYYSRWRGTTPRDWLLIAVQSSKPWDCIVYRLGPDDIERGDALCTAWLRRVAECTESGVWPGVADGRGVVDISLPVWAQGEEPEWEDTTS